MKIFKLLLKIALVVGIIVIAVVAAVVMKNRQCEEIKVSFFPLEKNYILTQKEIIDELTQNNINPIHQKIKEIKTESITERLNQNMYVKEVQGVYFSGNVLRIDLLLQQPVAHLFAQSGDQYLIAESGLVLPWLPFIKARVLVANGVIPVVYKKGMQADADTALNQIFRVATAIYHHSFFKSQISQLYLNEHHDLELVPLIGDQNIVIGNADQIEEKLANLQTVYERGLIYKGIEEYATFDLRFKNRVIAKTKKE